MGDAQSAQRDEKADGAAVEEAVKVDDAQDDDNIEKLLIKKEPISELKEKAGDPPEHLNGLCEDQVDAEVCQTNLDLPPPVEDGPNIPETVEPSKEEDSSQANVEAEEKEPVNAEDVAKPTMSEAEAKMNEINESFKRFFTTLGVKLTVKKDSEAEVTAKSEEGEASSPEDVKDTTEGATSDNPELNIDLCSEQEQADNATPSPTTTDITVEEDTLKEVPCDDGAEEEEEMSPIKRFFTTGMFEAPDTAKTNKEVPCEEEEAEDEEEVSPIKRFFTTGIFSGLAKKKADEEKPKEETGDKELVDMGNQEEEVTPEEAGEEQIKEEPSPEQNGGEPNIEILPTASDKDTAETIDAPEKTDNKENIPISNEAELLSSQERAKVQGSPLRKLLSGAAGLKKLKSKRRRGKKTAEGKITDYGEQLDSSTEGPSEGEEIINLSGEEHKKKAESSPSWETFLCGSGKKRSRKASDSEEETPKYRAEGRRSDDEHRNLADSPLESSQEGDMDHPSSSPEQAGSPSEGDGSSTWRSLKKLVTPKRKAKNDEPGKDQIPSDGEITKDDQSFSIKKLIPGRKKRKTDGKQEQMSSDEADRGVGGSEEEEDSETPAVVPLSEFDTEPVDDTQMQTQAVVESPILTEQGDTHQALSSQVTDLAIPSDILPPETDILPPETETPQDNNNVEQLSSTPVDEFEDLTEYLSKHQQLSDIPEEGVIDESVATTVSVTQEINLIRDDPIAEEEISRDDTIAEDFIELTSEAYTALEPIDSLMDETTEMVSAVSHSLMDETAEMVSAVSQLTESSKTSGNTTPVPAEHDNRVTDALLQEVVETICVPPDAVTTEDTTLEGIGVSVSPLEINEITEQEADVLEAHAELDAVAICSDLGSEEFIEPSDPITAAEDDTPQPDTDMFYDSNEPLYIEEESHADEDEAPSAELITNQVEEDVDDIPTVETLEIPEPLIDTVIPEVQSPEAIEAALNPYYDTVLAKMGVLDEMVVIKNVPSVQSMDDHEIQVQVVDADIQSAETAVETLIKNVPSMQCMGEHEIQVQVVDSAEIESAEAAVETLLEVVSTDALEVVDVCIEEEKAEMLSAALEIEEEVLEEASPIVTQDIMSAAEVYTGAGDATEKDGQYAEGLAFDTVDTDTENIQSSEKYLELESAIEVDRNTDSTAHAIPEESRALVVERKREEDTEEKTTQTVTHVVEQTGSAGVVSSAVHLGAPSSLTLEVKLNFQFGQTKEAGYVPHAVPARIESPSRTAVSEIVQAMEAKELQQSKVVNTGVTKPLKRSDVYRNPETGIIKGFTLAPKTVEPTRQSEEEMDQDVWLDAEENIYNQEATGRLWNKAVECPARQESRKTRKSEDANEEESQKETLAPDGNTGTESRDLEVFDNVHEAETETGIANIE